MYVGASLALANYCSVSRSASPAHPPARRPAGPSRARAPCRLTVAACCPRRHRACQAGGSPSAFAALFVMSGRRVGRNKRAKRHGRPQRRSNPDRAAGGPATVRWSNDGGPRQIFGHGVWGSVSVPSTTRMAGNGRGETDLASRDKTLRGDAHHPAACQEDYLEGSRCICTAEAAS